ncbi:MAG: hypothetical protein V3T58_00875 [Candidatus Hydrothermarchaeales archaeon]
MDFYQGLVTNIHDFGGDIEAKRKCLVEMAEERPISLVLPMLYREIEGKALHKIVRDLNTCDYVSQVLIPLTAKNSSEYRNVLKFFDRLKLPHLVLWCNGKRVMGVLDNLTEEGIDVRNILGKGRDTWIALGVASLDSYAIALHDADILTYTPDYPVKLLYPIIDPDLDFIFNKAYYARIGDGERRMYGRVLRLFLLPLLKALQKKVRYQSRFLRYLRSFRYALSGEFALTSDLALNISIPGDWGLEIGILTEVYRSAAVKRICQTDLGFHEHKHQKIGTSPSRGLLKMAGDIEKSLLRSLTEMEGIDISEAFLLSLQVLYRRLAQEDIYRYSADAQFNDIMYDRHMEESAVDTFSNAILKAGREYVKNPFGTIVPSWIRVTSAMPGIRNRLKEAALVDADKLG